MIDASHEKFRELYLAALKNEIDPSNIEYIVCNHTEPDHSGLVPDLLELAPNATVVGSKVCIQFLQNLVFRPFKTKIVKVCLELIYSCQSNIFILVFGNGNVHQLSKKLLRNCS